MMNIFLIVNSLKCTVLYTLFWTVLSALRYDLLDSFTSIDYCSLYCRWGAIYGIVNLENKKFNKLLLRMVDFSDLFCRQQHEHTISEIKNI